MEPPVSVPVAAGQIRPETTAALPPDEPPGAISALPPSLRRHGEITLPKALVSLDDPIANWSMFSLPSIPAPALNRFDDTVDSYGGVNPSRIRLAAVVATPWVQNRSFIPFGTPAILPRVSPAALALSVASAAARA